jgi:DNA repair exonuclease SbcCD ATPase subunit
MAMERPIMNRAASTLDGRPGAASVAEVFLSPRVIDREAYNELASSLRKIIEDAQAEGANLRGAAADAQLARDNLRDIASKSQPKLDAAAKALASLESHAQRAEALLNNAKQAAASLQSLSSDSQSAMRAAETQLNAKLDELKATQEARVAQVAQEGEAQVRQLAEKYQQAAATLAAEGEARLAQLRTLIEQSEHRLEERLRRGEEIMAQRWSAMHAQLDRMEAQAKSHGEAIDQQARALAGSAESRLTELSQQIDNRLIQSWTHASELLTKLEAGAAQARELLGTDEPGTPGEITETGKAPAAGGRSLRRLHALLEQAERTARQATDASTQLQAITSQAELVRSLLSEAINNASDRVDRLSSRAGELTTTLNQTMEAADSAQAALMARRDELEAMVAEPHRRLLETGQHLRETVQTILGQVQGAHRDADRATKAVESLLEAMRTLVIELKPWQPLLIERDPSAPLPEPLARLVSSVRVELGSDLARVASALQMVSARATSAAHSMTSNG